MTQHLPLVKSIRMFLVSNTRRSVSTVAQDIVHFFRGCLNRGKSSCVDLRSSVKCAVNLSTSGQHIQSVAVRHAILISLLVFHEVSFPCLQSLSFLFHWWSRCQAQCTECCFLILCSEGSRRASKNSVRSRAWSCSLLSRCIRSGKTLSDPIALKRANCAATNSRDWTTLVLPTVVVLTVTRVRLMVPTNAFVWEIWVVLQPFSLLRCSGGLGDTATGFQLRVALPWFGRILSVPEAQRKLRYRVTI